LVSSTSRTFRERLSGVKGFWPNPMPRSDVDRLHVVTEDPGLIALHQIAFLARRSHVSASRAPVEKFPHADSWLGQAGIVNA
jgi:hypothetical protein